MPIQAAQRMSALQHECTFRVPYAGHETIARLIAGCEGSTFAPVRDDMLPITASGDWEVNVEFPVSLEPTMHSEYGLIFKSTKTIMREVESLGMRGLNVPELLALGRVFPTRNFVALGQLLPTRFGNRVVYLYRGGVGSLPINHAWAAFWEIPATRDPDPLHES